MKKTPEKQEKSNIDTNDMAKKQRVSQADIPSCTVNKAIRVAQAIYDSFGKSPAKPLLVAKAMGMAPTAGSFRAITGASIAYGLTDAGYNAGTISLTPLAKRILAPTQEGDDLTAKKEATLKPKIISDFLHRYNGSPFPAENIACNVLEEMGIPKERTTAALKIIKECSNDVNFIVEIKGKEYVDLQNTNHEIKNVKTQNDTVQEEDAHEISKNFPEDILTPTIPTPQPNEKPKPIFIAHGKNKGPLDQLKKILEDFKIPYKVAIDEPNSGKLIPEKVKSLMRECGSAIFIFTGDEGKQFVNNMGEPELERQVPNLNVVFELGAASILYNDRIIIFKEDRVEFASDFSSIGYITFSNGDIQSKTSELFRELLSLGFIKITTAS